MKVQIDRIHHESRTVFIHPSGMRANICKMSGGADCNCRSLVVLFLLTLLSSGERSSKPVTAPKKKKPRKDQKHVNQVNTSTPEAAKVKLLPSECKRRGDWKAQSSPAGRFPSRNTSSSTRPHLTPRQVHPLSVFASS